VCNQRAAAGSIAERVKEAVLADPADDAATTDADAADDELKEGLDVAESDSDEEGLVKDNASGDSDGDWSMEEEVDGGELA
jgi:hypothetical protein